MQPESPNSPDINSVMNWKPYMNTLTAVHLVLDLETFDTKESATVFQIGIVAAHDQGYCWYLPTKEQFRTVSKETIEWWQQQTGPARTAFNEAYADYHAAGSTQFGREFLLREVTAVNKYIGEMKAFAKLMDLPFFFWGNSPTFDQRILSSLMYDLEIVPAWEYSDEADVRTIRKIFGGKIQSKLPHDALEDAKAEIEYLRSVKSLVFPDII